MLRSFSCTSCWHLSYVDPKGPVIDTSWLYNYRILYRTEDGAGLSDDFPGALGQSAKLKDETIPEIFDHWYQMHLSKPSKAHFFHKSCWTMLNRQLEEHPDLDKLFEVCQHIVYDGRYTMVNRVGELAEYTYFDPLEQPIIEGLIQARPRLPWKRTWRANNLTFSETDCFRLLPLEIRTRIARELSTSDFLRLRQVSRSMAEVFNDQHFWRTRFLPWGDCGFLSALLPISQDEKRPNINASKFRDWRLLYKGSLNMEEHHSYLGELRRRWHNNRWLADRYTMTKTSEADIKPDSRWIHARSWHGISLKGRCDRKHYQGEKLGSCGRCGMEHSRSLQAVPLEESVLGLAVYVLRESYHTCITGIGLLQKGIDKPYLILGYRIPECYVFIKIGKKKLIGFNVISGDYRIYAMQAVFKRGVSKWVGNQEGYEYKCSLYQCSQHYDVPTLRCLTTAKGVRALRAELDYCKLVGFYVG